MNVSSYSQEDRALIKRLDELIVLKYGSVIHGARALEIRNAVKEHIKLMETQKK